MSDHFDITQLAERRLVSRVSRSFPYQLDSLGTTLAARRDM
jgi:hypothetical protein